MTCVYFSEMWLKESLQGADALPAVQPGPNPKNRLVHASSRGSIDNRVRFPMAPDCHPGKRIKKCEVLRL